MECTRVFCCVVALSLAPVILYSITSTLAIELLGPDSVVLFPGDEHKLQVEHRTEHSLDSRPESLKLDFYKHCSGEKSNYCTKAKRHYLRSFSETKKNQCLIFDDGLENIAHIVRFCVDTSSSKWNGGVIKEKWPLNNQTWRERAFVTNTKFGQSGYYLYFDETVPLYVLITPSPDSKICFTAKGDEPPYYKPNNTISMKFHVCKFNNTREAHKNAISDFLGKPEDLPYNYESVVKNPIWSTRTKNWPTDVDAFIVQRYADEIVEHSFPYGTIEFDDQWKHCHCSSEFNESKLKKLTGIVKDLKGFNVSLWITPFVNTVCEQYCSIPHKEDYFVKNESNRIIIKTGSGSEAYYVDFTNPDASYWWGNATQKLLTQIGIRALIFVGGESSWYSEHPRFHENGPTYPDNVKAYLETMVRVGGATQHKSSRMGQRYGHFLRLLDYSTSGNMNLELSMLVPSLINANMLGYPFVIPNMIGKNRGQMPSRNLYIRWMQAVTFMPAVQYSYAPWEFDSYTTKICAKLMNIRRNYTERIIDLMKKSVAQGSPLNPPIWWIDPTDSEAHSINDEYLLGDSILVAPVLDEIATSRDIYLPAGLWNDETYSRKSTIVGRTWLRNYPASMNVLPWFTKVSEPKRP